MNALSYLSNDSDGVSCQGVPEPLPLIHDLFQESVAKWPDNIALVCTHQAANLYGIASVPAPVFHQADGIQDEERRPYLRWTFQKLKSGVDRLQIGLKSLGVRPGMTVVTFMPNCAEYVLTWWAARGMGLVMAPLNPRNLTNKEEVAHMLSTIMKGTGEQPPILIVFEQEYFEMEPLKSLECFVKVVVSTLGRQPQSEGVLFGDLMSTREEHGNAKIPKQDQQPTDDEILFTSGSTSRPKGVKIEYPILSLGMYNFAKTPGCETRPGDLWLALTPNNHGMGRGTLTASMCFGAGTVYPGFYFNAQEAADALLRERCTHAALVPTLVRLLADTVGPRLRKAARDTSLLQTVFLSGAPPTSADIQECIDILGIQSISSVYGMTEGAEAGTPAHIDCTKLFNSKGMLSVGVPRSRRAAIKICAPDAAGPDRPPLPLGTPGEIHYTGPERLPRSSIYIAKPDTDDFCYIDGQGRRWIVTGDRGVIGDDQQLYIIGRSKEMIIRGGENIAPAAIESCLAENPKLAHLSIQLVGTPDSIAGEVPVAIVATSAQELKRMAEEIHHTVVKKMGPMCVPSHIIPLEALGLTDWPRASTGKIRKAEVSRLVNKLLQDGEYPKVESRAMPKKDQLAREVLSIWARSVGLEETSLSIHQPISEFADSLTIARVIRRIKRSIPCCGGLSVKDMVQADTIMAQIDLIVNLASVHESTRSDDQGRSSLAAAGMSPMERHGPPSVEEMVHLTEQPDLLDQTKQLVLEAISKDGFGWDNVEDIFPAQNFVSELARTGVLESARFHFVDLVTTETDPERVRQAVHSMLCNNPILASFLIWNKDGHAGLDPELALHVTLRHDQKLFEHVVKFVGTVKTANELRELAVTYPEPYRSLFPGILFRALIYTIEETGAVGLVYNASHAVLDASSIWIFQEDLDHVLSGQKLRPHVDFRLWADVYYSFRGSPQARSAISWHARNLSGIEDHLEKALWPPEPQRGVFDPTGRGYPPGLQYSFQAPHLGALMRRYPGLSAPVILKSAFALLNVCYTEHTHALFSSYHDGRTKWPFMPPFPDREGDGLAGGLFSDAQDVAGPCIQAVTNLVEIKPWETVVAFLRRMKEDQDNLSRYAHAPWPDIDRALGVESGTMRRVYTTMAFNWVPGFGAQAQTARTKEPFKNIRVLAAVALWRVSVLCRIGLGGLHNDTVVTHLVGDALNAEQKLHFVKSLEMLTNWLTEPSHWEAPIEGFRDVKLQASEIKLTGEENYNSGSSCLLPG